MTVFVFQGKPRCAACCLLQMSKTFTSSAVHCAELPRHLMRPRQHKTTHCHHITCSSRAIATAICDVYRQTSLSAVLMKDSIAFEHVCLHALLMSVRVTDKESYFNISQRKMIVLAVRILLIQILTMTYANFPIVELQFEGLMIRTNYLKAITADRIL